MPYLNVVSNHSVSDEVALLKVLSQTIAKAVNKPEQYVMVAFEAKASMVMGGSDKPAAFLDYRALGLPVDRTAFSDVLCMVIAEHLGISGDRVYISMTDSERHNWGWNHSTF